MPAFVTSAAGVVHTPNGALGRRGYPQAIRRQYARYNTPKYQIAFVSIQIPFSQSLAFSAVNRPTPQRWQ